ncbi:surfeit locus protein 6 homolog [Scaptodrosophila lebanonensis]|uniref:Surfeit locus protein 6 homolog n=1 Tax=Drosophila lebanonensis TaxID=7225 RepID=A0A6J2TFP2_DROLE|nr:surfeit locus protein 6 homolog [Scaptodrosophila lebanonensis]
MTDTDIVKRIREYYDRENGLENSKNENLITNVKNFQLQVLNILTDHLIPYSYTNNDEEEDDYEEYLLPDDEKSAKKKRKAHLLAVKKNGKKASAATSTMSDNDGEDVDERIASIKNKLRQKKRPTTERAQRKREAKKLKRSKGVQKILLSSAKSLKNENVKQQKLKNGFVKLEENGEEADSKAQIKPVKVQPVYNEEAKIVYSKVDFAANPGGKTKKSHQNPREILKKLKDTRKQINELKEQGETEKAAEMQNEIAWKKAFEKVEGKKVKDDTKLLQKAIKKRKVEKRKSKVKWVERKERVEQDIAKRQKKRQENLDKRSKDKKNRKLKKASKKGRIIAGY